MEENKDMLEETVYEESDEDDVRKIFSSALENQDRKQELEEENKIETEPDTRYAEFIAPVLSTLMAVGSFFAKFWYAAYFGLIFGGVGIYMCKRKGKFLKRWVLIINLIPLATCFFLGCLWLLMFF